MKKSELKELIRPDIFLKMQEERKLKEKPEDEDKFRLKIKADPFKIEYLINIDRLKALDKIKITEGKTIESELNNFFKTWSTNYQKDIDNLTETKKGLDIAEVAGVIIKHISAICSFGILVELFIIKYILKWSPKMDKRSRSPESEPEPNPKRPKTGSFKLNSSRSQSPEPKKSKTEIFKVLWRNS